MLNQGVKDGLATLIPNSLAWSRVGPGREEGGGEGVGKVGLWEPLLGGEFILKAQTRKVQPNPQGLLRMGFSKRKH